MISLVAVVLSMANHFTKYGKKPGFVLSPFALPSLGEFSESNFGLKRSKYDQDMGES